MLEPEDRCEGSFVSKLPRNIRHTSPPAAESGTGNECLSLCTWAHNTNDIRGWKWGRCYGARLPYCRPQGETGNPRVLQRNVWVDMTTLPGTEPQTHEFVPASGRPGGSRRWNRYMEVGLFDCTTKQFLGQLRQFSFILTGDEATADAAVAEALTSARGHIAEADAFPCHRSWLFANLFRVLNDGEGSSASREPAHPWLVSLLEVRYDERALLVLVDGYRFDSATAALIIGASAETVHQTLTRARLAFHNLTRAASCDLNEIEDRSTLLAAEGR